MDEKTPSMTAGEWEAFERGWKEAMARIYGLVAFMPGHVDPSGVHRLELLRRRDVLALIEHNKGRPR